MKKIYYAEVRPLAAELRGIYEADPNNHDAAYDTILMYTLHKGGLIEDGITKFQFDIIFDAFIEAMNTMGEVVIQHQKTDIAKR